MYLKLFEEFLNEWKLKNHYENERGSRNHPASRIAPRSFSRPDGWICKELLETNSKGTPLNSKITLEKFLKLSSYSREEFNEMTTSTLEMIVKNDRVIKQRFEDPEPLHRMVCLGKILFKVKEQYFSPVFSSSYTETKFDDSDFKGNLIWADVKDDVAYTILFFPENYPYDKMLDKAYKPANRLIGTMNLSREDYKKKFRVSHLSKKDFCVTIPDTKDWLQEVENQTKLGKEYSISKDEKGEEKQKWESILNIPKATAIFDKGTKILVNDSMRIIESVTLKSDQIEVLMKTPGEKEMRRKIFSIGSLVDILVVHEEEERKIGNLPEEGDLYKTFKIEKISLQKDTKGFKKYALTGLVRDFFVMLPNGEKAFSPFK